MKNLKLSKRQKQLIFSSAPYIQEAKECKLTPPVKVKIKNDKFTIFLGQYGLTCSISETINHPADELVASLLYRIITKHYTK